MGKPKSYKWRYGESFLINYLLVGITTDFKSIALFYRPCKKSWRDVKNLPVDQRKN